MSIFGAREGAGLYSPFQAASGLGDFIAKSPARLQRFGITVDDVEKAGGQAASGGLLSTIRAAGDMDRLESKIARRTAAGKDVSKLTGKLERAQTSVRQIAGMTHPGLDVFNTVETTLGDLQRSQIRNVKATRPFTPGGSVRMNPATGMPYRGGATGGERVLSATGFPQSHRGRGGRFTPTYNRTGNINYFSSSSLPESYASASKVNITRELQANGSYRYTAHSEAAGRSRRISAKAGEGFFQKEVGYSGNVLASSVGGAINQSIMGYMRGAQGYLYSGGLTGLAKEKAMKAQSDFVRIFNTLDDAAKTTIRSDLGIKVTDDFMKGMTARAGGAGRAVGFEATIDDILAAQRAVAEAGGNAGRALTVDSFSANTAQTDRRMLTKRLSPDIPYSASGQDLVHISNVNTRGRTTMQNFAVNTELVEGTGRTVQLTGDVTEHLARQQSTALAERELYERTIGRRWFWFS